MRKLIGVWLMVVSMMLSSGLTALHAQEEKSAPEEHKTRTEDRLDSGQQGSAEKTMRPYRADFLISELDDGKRINARHYSMVLNVGAWNQVKIGTKVPVSSGNFQGQAAFQYMDVGTSINCKLIESGNDLAIDVHADFSSLSGPEDQHSPHPVVRQVTLSGNTVVVSGKPVIVGVVDDPSSTRQFQLEATVTKLR